MHILTDTTIRAASAQDKPRRIFDGGGLYLEVSPSGGKWWRFKHRFAERQKSLLLGTALAAISQARDRAP